MIQSTVADEFSM